MSRNGRLIAKIILIILGVLIIGYILTVSIRMNMVKQPEGTYIRLQDALILGEAFQETAGEDARYMELEQALEGNGEALLTYRQLLDLLAVMTGQQEGQEQPQNPEAAEMTERPKETVETIKREYKRKYKEDYYILLEDWYRIYDEMLYAYGKNEIIYPVTVTVLGTEADIAGLESASDQPDIAGLESASEQPDIAGLESASDQPDIAGLESASDQPDIAGLESASEQSDIPGTESRKLLTEEGVMDYCSDTFRQNKYQAVSAYQKADRLLTIRSVAGRGMKLSNVWIMETEEDRLQAFYHDYEIWFPYVKDGKYAEDGGSKQEWREQVADLDFADGRLQSVKVKPDKINGKLLSIRDGKIEIEGLGTYPYAEGMKVYCLYGSLSECEQNDLKIGYDFTDFVLDGGVICAGLITRDEAMENIRVVVKNTDYAGAYHEKVELTSDTGFTMRYGTYDHMEQKELKAGEIVTIDGESEYFTGDRIYIEPAALTGRVRLLSVKRAQGTPSYRGKLEIAKTPDGLVVVNEALLEEYLYSVVPSEMPASYPLEALKAQAVCARTYAYQHMVKSGIAGFGAHVDDSAGYQVYNNIAENTQTTKAVKETAGQLLYYGEELCGSYYYSTSCGFGTDTDIWKSDSREDTSYLQARRIAETAAEYNGDDMTAEEKFSAYISKNHPEDFENSEPWYRWTYEVKEIGEAHILEILQQRYAVNEKLILTENKEGEYESRPVEKLGKIKALYISKRNSGGAADELVVRGTKNTYKVISEHNIRYVLSDGKSKVIRQDGSEIASGTLLPSAYFTITAGKEDDIVVGYSLIGGGYGHGVGMSQNGASQMAKRGFSSEDILAFFYRSCEVKDIYRNLAAVNEAGNN